MTDQNWQPEIAAGKSNDSVPAGVLQRALYLWERQAPSSFQSPNATDHDTARTEDHSESDAVLDRSDYAAASDDLAIEERLKRHAGRLAALERVIPGDKRLDPPRFSLMMLNAFLGRAVTEGIVSARLPGLTAISDRIDTELSDLEFEHPAALDGHHEDAEKIPVQIRDEMRALFADLKSGQKAHQRQIVSSLSALHAAISDLRSKLPDREPASDVPTDKIHQAPSAPREDLAKPLVDPDKLVDPRPILAAARAAASRVTSEPAPFNPRHQSETTQPGKERSYRSVLLGSALLGLLIMIFGREAAQFISASPLTTGAISRP